MIEIHTFNQKTSYYPPDSCIVCVVCPESLTMSPRGRTLSCTSYRNLARSASKSSALPLRRRRRPFAAISTIWSSARCCTERAEERSPSVPCSMNLSGMMFIGVGRRWYRCRTRVHLRASAGSRIFTAAGAAHAKEGCGCRSFEDRHRLSLAVLSD